MPTLSILIPTCGRPTIRWTLESATSQLRDGDEILVRHNTQAAWGNTSRDRLMQQAQGDYLMFIDDDDRLLPGALDAVRDGVRRLGDLHIFRLASELDGEIWRTKELRPGNVGTPMLVVKNRPPFPSWAGDSSHLSDFAFASRMVEARGNPVWHEQVIAEVRPRWEVP